MEGLGPKSSEINAEIDAAQHSVDMLDFNEDRAIKKMDGMMAGRVIFDQLDGFQDRLSEIELEDDELAAHLGEILGILQWIEPENVDEMSLELSNKLMEMEEYMVADFVVDPDMGPEEANIVLRQSIDRAEEKIRLRSGELEPDPSDGVRLGEIMSCVTAQHLDPPPVLEMEEGSFVLASNAAELGWEWADSEHTQIRKWNLDETEMANKVLGFQDAVDRGIVASADWNGQTVYRFMDGWDLASFDGMAYVVRSSVGAPGRVSSIPYGEVDRASGRVNDDAFVVYADLPPELVPREDVDKGKAVLAEREKFKEDLDGLAVGSIVPDYMAEAMGIDPNDIKDMTRRGFEQNDAGEIVKWNLDYDGEKVLTISEGRDLGVLAEADWGGDKVNRLLSGWGFARKEDRVVLYREKIGSSGNDFYVPLEDVTSDGIVAEDYVTIDLDDALAEA